jgi:hypothetical protein
MKPRTVTIPELALIAGTRVALGAGIGLLLGSRLSPEPRRAVGWALFTIGALTTIPLAAGVLFRCPEEETAREVEREKSHEKLLAGASK